MSLKINNLLNTVDALNNYSGKNDTEKIKALINDVSNNYKEVPMTIVIAKDFIEINEDLIIKGWKNKTIIVSGALWFNNCNAIILKEIQFCKIYFNRIASNQKGLISINSVDKLTKNGIIIWDSSYNTVEINEIVGFSVGIKLYSEYGNLGTLYKKIFFNSIWRCKQAIELISNSASDNVSYISGWVNENSFWGGMIDCNRGVKIGQDVGDRATNEPDDQYHDNKFYNIGFEQIRDNVDPVAIDMIQGRSNAFLYPRFEGSTSVKGYVLIREEKDALMNVYETSNYMMEVSRIELNTSKVRESGKVCPCNSIVKGDIRENTGMIANKMIAQQEKIFYEGIRLWIDILRPNTLNWEYSEKYLARYNDSNGKIRIIGYDS